ncbi:hypothetical protein ABPG72_006207 [Tetrahymena utriculariae]
MSDSYNGILIEDNQPFNLKCYNSLVPLYSPYYFHNHKMVVYNEDQLEIIKQTIIEHYQSHLKCIFDDDCQIDPNSDEFLMPKKQIFIQELLTNRVLSTSHEEYIQKDNNDFCMSTDVKSFYKNKIYLPFKEDDYQITANLISENFQIFEIQEGEESANNYYWNNIDQFIQNDIFVGEDDHFNLQKQYKAKYFFNLCLLTGNIVLIPIRLNGCQHLECFDLNSIYRFIIEKKTVTISCPICHNEANFLDQSKFYLDKKLIKIINKNTSFSPVWSFVSDEFGLQDILRCNKKLDISKLNKVYWKSKKHDKYNDYVKQHYRNFNGQLIHNCSQDNIQPIPVRCTKCIDFNKYCDLAQQLLIPDQCLCCGQKFSPNNEEFLNELRIDFILLKEITKYVQIDIKSFLVCGISQDSIILQPPYQTILSKIQKVSNESYDNTTLVIRQDMFTGQRIEGIPVRWKDCRHKNCIDFYKHSLEAFPRYCEMCKKTYKFDDLVWDEVILNSLRYYPECNNLQYQFNPNQNQKQYEPSDIELSQQSKIYQGQQVNFNQQNNYLGPTGNNYQNNNNNNNARYYNFIEASPQTQNNLKQTNFPQTHNDQVSQQQNVQKNKADSQSNTNQQYQAPINNPQLKQVPNFQNNNIQNQLNQSQNGNKQPLQDDAYANAFKNGRQKFQQLFNSKPNSYQTYQFKNYQQVNPLDESIPFVQQNQNDSQNKLNIENQQNQIMNQQQQQRFQQQQNQQLFSFSNNQPISQQQLPINQQFVQNKINQQTNSWQMNQYQHQQNYTQVQQFSFENIPIQQNQTQIAQQQVTLGSNQLPNQNVFQNQQAKAQFYDSQIANQVNFPVYDSTELSNSNQTGNFNQIQNQIINSNQIQGGQIPQALQNQNDNPFIPNYYKINQQFEPFGRSNKQVQQRSVQIPQVLNSISQYYQPDIIRDNNQQQYNLQQPIQEKQIQQQQQQNPQNQIKQIIAKGQTFIFKQIAKK